MKIANKNRSNIVKHYGSSEFIYDQFKSIKNSNWCKPSTGGLWTSPIDSNWSWKDFCDVEHVRTISENNSFELILNDDANILVIDELKDLLNAPLINNNLNFELISNTYDAIWLTENGQSATRWSHPCSLYGWDVETVLILNKDCFKIKKD